MYLKMTNITIRKRNVLNLTYGVANMTKVVLYLFHKYIAIALNENSLYY